MKGMDDIHLVIIRCLMIGHGSFSYNNSNAHFVLILLFLICKFVTCHEMIEFLIKGLLKLSHSGGPELSAGAPWTNTVQLLPIFI